MLFANIPGLTDLKAQLITGVRTGKIAHAQLFWGKSGTANLPLALAYATYLNCESPSETDSCGVCNSCHKNLKFIHPDFQFSFPTAANDSIKGDDSKLSNNFLKYWRSFLLKDPFASAADWVDHIGAGNRQLNLSKDESKNVIKNLSLKAFEGKFKIMMIWLPEYLHPAAANALLKIIEEPSDKTVFLLVSNNREQLIGTIRSRTQAVHIPNYSDEEVKELLISKYEVGENKAKQLAHIAQGDLHKAVSLIDDVADDAQQEFEQWMRECWANDYTKLVKRSEDYHKLPKLNQQQWFVHAENILRESLVALMQSPELMRVPDEHEQFVLKFSKTLSLEKIELMNDILNKAIYYLERNASAKMTLLNVSLQLSAILRRK